MTVIKKAFCPNINTLAACGKSFQKKSVLHAYGVKVGAVRVRVRGGAVCVQGENWSCTRTGREVVLYAYGVKIGAVRVRGEMRCTRTG